MAKFEFRILGVSDDVVENVRKELEKEGFQNVNNSQSVACDLKSVMDFPTEKDAKKRAQEFYDKNKKIVKEVFVIKL
jgi:hypothetical protein